MFQFSRSASTRRPGFFVHLFLTDTSVDILVRGFAAMSQQPNTGPRKTSENVQPADPRPTLSVIHSEDTVCSVRQTVPKDAKDGQVSAEDKALVEEGKATNYSVKNLVSQWNSMQMLEPQGSAVSTAKRTTMQDTPAEAEDQHNEQESEDEITALKTLHRAHNQPEANPAKERYSPDESEPDLYQNVAVQCEHNNSRLLPKPENIAKSRSEENLIQESAYGVTDARGQRWVSSGQRLFRQKMLPSLSLFFRCSLVVFSSRIGRKEDIER